LYNLRKRNAIVVDCCCMCKKSGKSIDHLLLHRDIERELWSSFFHLFGIVWIMPRRVREMLVSWGGQMGNRNALEMWRLAPLCLMWCIWRGQNAMNFKNWENHDVELKKMLQSLYTWIAAFNSLPVSNFSEFFYSYSLFFSIFGGFSCILLVY
jgi:hypothetical protein